MRQSAGSQPGVGGSTAARSFRGSNQPLGVKVRSSGPMWPRSLCNEKMKLKYSFEYTDIWSIGTTIMKIWVTFSSNVAAPSLNRFSRLHSRFGRGGPGRLLAPPPGNRSMALGIPGLAGMRFRSAGKSSRTIEECLSPLLRAFVDYYLKEGSRVNQSPEWSDDTYIEIQKPSSKFP